MDVTTACHLGVCIAVRIAEAVPLVNGGENGKERVFTNMQVESALWISRLGKRFKDSSRSTAETQ